MRKDAIMAEDENIKKDIGLAEIAAGATAGVTTAALISSMAGNSITAGSAIPTKDEFWQKVRARIQSPRGNAITFPIFQEFRKLHPPPANTASTKVLKAWTEQMEQHCNTHPDYIAFCEAEKKIAVGEYANTIQEALKKAGKPSTVDDIMRAMDEIKPTIKPSAWQKPLLAFKSLSLGGKIGVGAVGLAAAVGVGYAVNMWRNSKGTHVEQLEQERAAPKFRTLSDI